MLISSRRTQLAPLEKAFNDLGVKADFPTGQGYIDDNSGRFVYSVLRIVSDLTLNDYIAHRVVLGLIRGIGSQICINIKNKVVQHNLRFLELFYDEIPERIFSTREKTALQKAKSIFEAIKEWRDEDTLEQRKASIAELIQGAFENQDAVDCWEQVIADLPDGISLGELRKYLTVTKQEQRAKLLEEIYTRLEMDIPETGFFPQAVQVMTMHSSKGLNAKIVFVPGLEDEILPGYKRKAYPGLVLEAARLLYVSITRAKVACILTYAESRQASGTRDYNRVISSFARSIGSGFLLKEDGLTDTEVDEILNADSQYKLSEESHNQSTQ